MMEKTWMTSAHQGYVKNGIYQNTLAAYMLAAQKGADMIETDARMTKDGVLIVNHDSDIKAFDADGNAVRYEISETEYSVIASLRFSRDGSDSSRIPTLGEVLSLAYFTGMHVNIDMKEGLAHAEEIARAVVCHGMRGRAVYATNGAGEEAIRCVLKIDPDARFIDTKQNFTEEKLSGIENYRSRCYVYTSDFSDENIAQIRKSGCMLAAISLNADNAEDAFRHHPDMAEYPHTSDFEAIDREVLKKRFSR